jgi:hypothetical protein
LIGRRRSAFPEGAEGVITLAGVEHCFVYMVRGDVVDAVIGPPDYIEQILNDRGLSTHQLPGLEDKH